MSPGSERGLEGEVHGATVLEKGLRAVEGDAARSERSQIAEVVDVLQVEAVLAVGVQAQPRRPAAGAFVAAGAHGRVAVDAARIAQGHRQVRAREDLEPGGR